MGKKNILIVADCNSEELETFVSGLKASGLDNIQLKISKSNWKRNFFTNLYRYLKYFTFPFSVFIHANQYSVIVGWQQFYTLNISFFFSLFFKRKNCKLVACNFTYKPKRGIIGYVYEKYMNLCVKNVDYLHVLSNGYVETCSHLLNVEKQKFIVTAFGIEDTFEHNYDLSLVDEDNYVISVGRSNRDFDYLVDLFRHELLKSEKLVIVSDSYVPECQLPENVVLKGNVKSEESFAWLKTSKLNIVSIDKGDICSGDTVLLRGMMFAKPTIITAPSTLAEMYIKDGVDGLFIRKDLNEDAKKLRLLLDDKERMTTLGLEARKKFLSSYTRFIMARDLGQQID